MLPHNILDKLIIGLDTGLRTLLVQAQASRALPMAAQNEEALCDADKSASQRLMRVNHAGEVCAQALYLGQALTARTSATQNLLQLAASEELDHLAWCESRLAALGGHTSV